MPRLVAYTYANPAGPDHDTTGVHPPCSATSTIGIRESTSPGTVTYVRPTAPVPLYDATAADQMAAFSAKASAYAPAGSYGFGYDPTTQRVYIQSLSALSFAPVFPEKTAAWLGFTQAIVGYDTNWLAASPPAGVVELYGVTVEPPEDAARVELREYRHGRAIAVAWGNHASHRCTLHIRADDARAFDPGYLLAGRVRLTQVDTIHTDYSQANLGGVIDGFVIATTDLAEDGDLGELWTLTMLVAVPRG